MKLFCDFESQSRKELIMSLETLAKVANIISMVIAIVALVLSLIK